MKLIAVIGMFAVSAAVLLAAPVDYVKEIKPLLREQCYHASRPALRDGEFPSVVGVEGVYS